jgi:hypothetical protein
LGINGPALICHSPHKTHQSRLERNSPDPLKPDFPAPAPTALQNPGNEADIVPKRPQGNEKLQRSNGKNDFTDMLA